MTVNRQDMQRAAAAVRPAISAQGYIKAYTHLRLDVDGITACDDIHALNVRIDHDLSCLVPGDVFIKALAGFLAEDVKITAGDNVVTMKSGRGTLKLPTLPVSDFPFQWPRESGDVLKISDDILKGIRHCLVGVGSNVNFPAQMGVTIDQEGGVAILYSTDNVTITRYESETKIKLPADAPVLLPTFFCDQMLSLAKLFPKEELVLHMVDNAFLLKVGDRARMNQRMLVQPTPLDFPNIIKRNLGSIEDVEKSMSELPPGWDEVLQRAQLVTSTTEPRMEIEGDGETLQLFAKSDMGELSEALRWDGPPMKRPVLVNPALLSRVSGVSSHLFFGAAVVALCNKDASLLHVIATFGKK